MNAKSAGQTRLRRQFQQRFRAPARPAVATTLPRLSTLDIFAAGWFTALNLAAWFAFGFDKWQAGRKHRRVPESTLMLLGALGGWPGGLIAMKMFRHKTLKRTFQIKYALALLPFAAEVWAWWHWR